MSESPTYVSTGSDTVTIRGASDVANCVLTGGYYDTNGVWIPMPGYPTYMPSYSYNLFTSPPEKPHEVVKRATTEIAAAARDLLASAEAMGVDMSEKDLHDAILKRVKDALKS